MNLIVGVQYYQTKNKIDIVYVEKFFFLELVLSLLADRSNSLIAVPASLPVVQILQEPFWCNEVPHPKRNLLTPVMAGR